MITTKHELKKLIELESRVKDDLKIKKDIYDASHDKYICNHSSGSEWKDYSKARNLAWSVSQALQAALYEMKSGFQATGRGFEYLQEVKKNI